MLLKEQNQTRQSQRERRVLSRGSYLLFGTVADR